MEAFKRKSIVENDNKQLIFFYNASIIEERIIRKGREK